MSTPLKIAWQDAQRPAAIALLAFAMADSALAHDPGLSAATFDRAGQSVSIHLAMSRADVERLVTMDSNHDGAITAREWRAALPALEDLGRSAYSVTAGGAALRPLEPVVTLDDRDVQFQIPLQGAAAGRLSVRAAMLDKLPRGHRQYFCLRDAAQITIASQMLEAAAPAFTADLPVETASAPAARPFREFIALGVEHIATGYDHLLFLLGLLIVGGTLRGALQIITSFTLAHSITLALATLNIVNISPKIIEPMIAASIVFVGVQNVLVGKVEKRWLLTFGFGLIHGCGFASALRDLGVGANGGGIAVPLLSFNLGVEMGQLAIAALALPLIWKCQSSPMFVRRVVPVCSVAIVLAGGYWFLQRTVL